MQKIGYIFPGQGAQYVGMGLDLYEKYQAARDVFDRANTCLGFDLKKICFHGPKEELTRTDISQPAIVMVSVAALKALEEMCRGDKACLVPPTAAAGLSLGEYSALVSAGVLSFEDAVSLVYKRGQFMQEAADKNKGRMASVIGFSKDALEKIAEEAGVQIANLNCPGQIVISGLVDDVKKAGELAKSTGAGKVVLLNVSGPFHSRYMHEAGERLKKEFEKAKFYLPKFPVAANVTARYHGDIEDIKKNLINQVTSSVLWEDSMRLMFADAIDTFLEIGPGSVLKGLARRIDSNVKVYNIGKAEEIEKFVRTEILNSKF